MWFLKLTGFLLMTGGGAYLGYKKSSHYKNREKLLSETILLCDSIINDITYFQPALKELLNNRLYSFNALKQPLTDYIRLIESTQNIHIDILKNNITKGSFNDEEFTLFIQLLDILGKSDSQTQRGGILSIKEALLIKQQSALEERKKYGGLYFKLGVLGGLTAGVIIL